MPSISGRNAHNCSHFSDACGQRRTVPVNNSTATPSARPQDFDLAPDWPLAESGIGPILSRVFVAVLMPGGDRRRLCPPLGVANAWCLGAQIWWYRRLYGKNQILAGQMDAKKRTRRPCGELDIRRVHAKPRLRRCSFQSIGNLISFRSLRAVKSGGCFPLRIARTISGANNVRRNSRVA
jgi:hypothetical protein